MSANHSSPDHADPGVPRRALAVQTLVVTHDLSLPRHREHLKMIILFCYKNIFLKYFYKDKNILYLVAAQPVTRGDAHTLPRLLAHRVDTLPAFAWDIQNNFILKINFVQGKMY